MTLAGNRSKVVVLTRTCRLVKAVLHCTNKLRKCQRRLLGVQFSMWHFNQAHDVFSTLFDDFLNFSDDGMVNAFVA